MYHSEVRCICNKLNPFSKEQNNFSFNSIIMTPSLALLLGLLSAEFPDNYLPLIFILHNSKYGFMLSLALKFILALQFHKTLFRLLFTILSIYIFHLAITPIASILCILVFQSWCHCCTQHSPPPPMATDFAHNSIKMMFLGILGRHFITVFSTLYLGMFIP